jgi:hypothetical protein
MWLLLSTRRGGRRGPAPRDGDPKSHPAVENLFSDKIIPK